MPLTGASPTTGAASRTESQVVGGIIGSRDSERSQGSFEPDCSCATPAWPLAEVGAEPANGCLGSLDGWELMASEGGYQVYKKPYLDAGLFQYKGIMQKNVHVHVHVQCACICTCTPVLYSGIYVHVHVYIYLIDWVSGQYGQILHECAEVFSRAEGE